MMKDLFYAIATPTGIPKVNADASQVASIVSGILMLAGALAIVFVIVGAIQYIIARGDASKIKQAKDGILYAIIGLVVTAVAFFIVQIVIGVF